MSTFKIPFSTKVGRKEKPVCVDSQLQDSNTDISSLSPRELVDLKVRIHKKLLTLLDISSLRDSVPLSENHNLRVTLTNEIKNIIVTENILCRTGQDEHDFIQSILDEMLGLSQLENYLRDPSVTEIMVNGPHQVYIERAGKLVETDTVFLNDSQLMRVIERIVSPIGRRIDESSPMVDARLQDGSRVNAIIPPLSLIGPVLTIRKFSTNFLHGSDLVKMNTLTEDALAFLSGCVERKLNILVSGGTGSGKTTLLNILSSFISNEDRVVTIEDAAELKMSVGHVISLEARPANSEGRGNITIRDLVKNALRMRPDRIIVGEVRGAEALDMLQAMNTGHTGSLTTCHANSTKDALARLETMVLMAGMDLPLKAVRSQIASAIDLIIQQARMPDGTRRIVKITQVLGNNNDDFELNDIYKLTSKSNTVQLAQVGEYVEIEHDVPLY